MINIDFLKNHPKFIPELVKIWYDVLGKNYVPNINLKYIEQILLNHSNYNKFPITFVAFKKNKPVGMCSLRIEDSDGILPEWIFLKSTPWFGSLVVDKKYQRQGIGTKLINAIKRKACALGIKILYTFTFNKKMPSYYKKRGWQITKIKKYKNQPVAIMRMKLENHNQTSNSQITGM